MLETFQDRLVTELRLAGASNIDQAKEVLQEFLPKINARFAVAAEQPETAYAGRAVLAETICLKDTRKVARDNTVKYSGPAMAGFANSVMVRYLDYNDIGVGGHPSDSIPGALAMADYGQAKQSGSETKRGQAPPTKQGDIFAFHLRGHSRWTTT